MPSPYAKRTRIVKALNAKAPMDEIVVCGWVRTKRDSRDFSFLEINDGSCLANIQCIIDGKIPTYSLLDLISTGAAVKVTGKLVESPGKGQKWEVQAGEIAVIGTADTEDYPLQKKRHTDEFLRSIAHLRARTNKYGAMFRIRSEATFAIHEYFREEGFFYVHTPILTGSDAEGAGEMFRVTTLPPVGGKKYKAPEDPENLYEKDFFGKECNLTVSGQLEAENLAMGLGKVYTFGPTFRAENSNTPRHCAEFWMVEPEMAFADLEDNMDLGENLTREVLTRVLDRCASDIELFANFVDKDLMNQLNKIKSKKFERISYTDAVKILHDSKVKFEFPAFFGVDLQTEHERFLAEQYFDGPVIVYDYPKEIKAFYMRQNDDGKTVAAMDLLVPRIGELIGGSQREERLDLLKRRIMEMSLPMDDYWWYLDLRRFGSVPHSGFGLGFERLLMMLTGVTNIRDVIPFPRTPKNLEF